MPAPLRPDANREIAENPTVPRSEPAECSPTSRATIRRPRPRPPRFRFQALVALQDATASLPMRCAPRILADAVSSSRLAKSRDSHSKSPAAARRALVGSTAIVRKLLPAVNSRFVLEKGGNVHREGNRFPRNVVEVTRATLLLRSLRYSLRPVAGSRRASTGPS